MSGALRTVLIGPTSYAEVDPAPLEVLRAAGFEPLRNELGRRLTAAEVVELGRDCVGIIAGVEPLTAEVLQQLPSLRCVSRCGVGAENVDIAMARKLGIAVRVTPDAPTVAVAELAIGLMLALMRHVPQASRDFHEGKWRKHTGLLLEARTVGLVGLGRIGRAVATRLQSFGCRLVGSDPAIDAAAAAAAALNVTLMPLPQLLSTADIVSLHVSMPSDAPPLLGARELAMMPVASYVVNVSRGNAIDESALVEALRSGHIAGAALDVFEREPYEGPLRGMAQVIATPHLGSYARETRIRMELEAAHNLIAALEPARG